MIGVHLFNLVQSPAHIKCARLIQIKNVISLRSLNKQCELKALVFCDGIQSVNEIRFGISDNTSVERIDGTIFIFILVFYKTVISITSCSISIEYLYWFIFPEEVYIIADIACKNI